MTPIHSVRPVRAVLLAATLGLAAALTVSGCSGSSGGDTTCAQYLNQSAAEQKDTITDYLESAGESTKGFNINANQLAVTAYCNTVGEPDTKIKDINDEAAGHVDDFMDMFQ